MAVNGANFLFNVLMSRMLGEVSYGALGSLLGIVSVLGVVFGALQLAITQSVAEGEGASKGCIPVGRAVIATSLAGTTLFLLTAAFSPPLAAFLHLRSVIPVLLLGAYVAPSLAGIVPQGVLIGERRFVAVAWLVLAGAVSRIVLGVSLVSIGAGLDGALLASVGSTVITLVLMVWLLRSRLQLGTGSARLGVHLGPALLSLVALSSVTLFSMIDSILARHYLAPKEAGAYVAASTAARIALVLPGAVATVAFPRLAGAKIDGTDPTKLLRQSLGVTAVLVGAAGLAMLAVPDIVVSTLFGSSYGNAIPVVRVLGLASVALALVGQLVYVFISRHSRLATVPWIGVVGAVVLITMFHRTAMNLAWAMLALSGFVLMVLLWPAMRRPEADNHSAVGYEAR